MMDYVLVSNIEEVRQEAELSDGRGKQTTILYENESGWQLNQFEEYAIPEYFLAQLKVNMQAYANRKGGDAPNEMSRGEMALWLMLKDDGTAVGIPYEANHCGWLWKDLLPRSRLFGSVGSLDWLQGGRLERTGG